MIQSNPCKLCGSKWHTKMSCSLNTKRKPIKTVGKKTNKWLAFRRKWLRNHPASHEGYYTCYICLRDIQKEEITLDHVIARSKRPDLVFSESNIRPACYTCNSDKGSKNW